MRVVKLNDLPITTTSHNGVGKKRQMIPNGLVPRLTQFAQISLSPDEVAIEHKHEDMYEIFFIQKGKGIIRINGKNYPIEKGVCITVEPHELHEVTNIGQSNLILICFGIVEE